MELKTITREENGQTVTDKILVDDQVANANNVWINGNVLIGSNNDDVHFVNSLSDR